MESYWVLHVNGQADVLVGPFPNMTAVAEQLLWLASQYDELSGTIVISREGRPPQHMYQLELTPESERIMTIRSKEPKHEQLSH